MWKKTDERHLINMEKICLVAAVLTAAILTALTMRRMELRAEAKLDQARSCLSEEVLRFHVLANSDSEEDQALKMKVKEEVISYMERELPNAKSVEETVAWAVAHKEELRKRSERIISEEGYAYPVRVEVTACEFPEKSYGDVTFPAGEYEALRIEIGKGEGKNWWCVLYPNLCFLDAVHAVVPKEGKDKLRSVLDEEEYELVTSTTKFKIKWFFLGED